MKLEDFKRKFALDGINEKTLQRLEAELEHLKLVNRHWYNIEIERFQEVKHAQRSRQDPDTIAEMIAELPSDYLPSV